MLSLSHTAGHAIQALACLAEAQCNPGFIRTVAQCSGVPAPYLAKIFKKLNDAGIVKSKRGFRGGVWLARPPSQISLLDISKAVDGADCLSGCLLGNAFCSDERSCPTHAFWKMHRAAIATKLAELTLDDIVKFNQRKARARHKAGSRRTAA